MPYDVLLNSPKLSSFATNYLEFLISHNQLPSGLVAQLVECSMVIGSRGGGFEPHQGQRFLLFVHAGPFPFEG